MKLTALLFSELLKNIGSVSQGRRLYLQLVTVTHALCWQAMIVTDMCAASDRNCRWTKVVEHGRPSLRQPVVHMMAALHGRPGCDR